MVLGDTVTTEPKLDGKAPYEKPALRTIELVAEETLGYGCKIFPGHPMGRSGAGCNNALCALTLGS
jgi:hypothetical protein